MRSWNSRCNTPIQLEMQLDGSIPKMFFFSNYTRSVGKNFRFSLLVAVRFGLNFHLLPECVTKNNSRAYIFFWSLGFLRCLVCLEFNFVLEKATKMFSAIFYHLCAVRSWFVYFCASRWLLIRRFYLLTCNWGQWIFVRLVFFFSWLAKKHLWTIQNYFLCFFTSWSCLYSERDLTWDTRKEELWDENRKI